jgi:hypothetical protein
VTVSVNPWLQCKVVPGSDN